jgi:DNA invertase Pin-like site-specific DNA recombinase
VQQCVNPLASTKIEKTHLSRLAVVYVRQSSMRQVKENIESTQLQYDLVRKAQAFGWHSDRIEVIDDDLGVSGSSTHGRSGFQRLLAELSLGHVGIVMGIEMSRLARNCRDWHQLLELCAVFGALLGDADGIYNPRDHNDRLLLGLKGTMSEAELHVLKSRLHAGKMNKARRGEYYGEAPIGYVRTREGVALEHDTQAQNVVRMIFAKFEELGSVYAVLRYLCKEQVSIGRRQCNGLYPDEVTWHAPNRSTIMHILKHPIYAGAYVFGRSESVTTSSSSGERKTIQRQRTKMDEWEVVIRDHLPAYITWEQWEQNQRQLRENSTRFGFGTPRGSSLLTGRVVCGRCGAKMPVHYRDGIPSFDCSSASMCLGHPGRCQAFNARWLEPLIEELVLQALAPASLDLSLAATDDIEADRVRLESHHQHSVERARYAAELARRRYEEVDPGNRLVAAELEKRWEDALVVQRKREEEFSRFQLEQPTELTEQQRESIRELSNDLRKLWSSSSTSGKDRQALVRILIDRIVVEVVEKTERLSVTVHWSGGFTSQHETRRTVMRFDELENVEELLARTRDLYNSGCPRDEIMRLLNAEGFKPARKERFTDSSINALFLVLRRKGMIGSSPTMTGPWWRSGILTEKLGIKPPTLTGWRHRGWVQAKQFGRRWIYWACPEELKRLKQLADYPAGIVKPAELTNPKANMPGASKDV